MLRVSVLVILLNSIVPYSHADMSQGSVQFQDITQKAGIDFVQYSGHPKKKELIIEAKGGGLAMFDADGDGWLDIFFACGQKKLHQPDETISNRLYRNKGDGTFEDITDKAGVHDSSWTLGCAAGDYDNDGDIDLYVTNHGSNRLYRNRGDGTFENMIVFAKCNSDLMTTGASFGDIDLDGDLDLVVADYLDLTSLDRKPPNERKADWRGFAVYPGPRAYKAQGMYLFRNQGDGRFENITQTCGFLDSPPAYSFSCLWSDLNGDRYPELYVANDSMPSYLFINNGDCTFYEDGLMAGAAYSEDGTEMASMGSAFGDANGDFKWDLAVTNFSEEPFSVLIGNGDGTFEDMTYISGVGNLTYSSLGWGTLWIDADNDGDEDLFFSNGHVYPEADHPDVDTSFAQSPMLFENDGEGHFTLAASGLGDDFYRKRVGRGAVCGDLDRDGDLDIVMNNLGNAPAILRNDGGNRNHWLQVELEGTKSNRNAIGAVAKLYAGNIRSMRAVRSGSSFLSQNSMVLHFGLAQNKTVDRLVIEWPSGAVTERKDIPINQRIHIKEE